MKNKKILGGIIAVAVVLLITFLVRNRDEETSADNQRTVKVAIQQNYYPYNFVNENGEADGYEVAVFKELEKKLPQYHFEFIPTSNEDLLIGLESGKYNAGIKGSWYTEERAKKFIIPENYHGASVIGLTIRAEDKDKYQSIDDFAKDGGKLVPISPQNAQYAVIQEYNEKNPDHPIDLVAADQFDLSDAYGWVLEGRYDAYFSIDLSYQNSVESEDGPYHDKADQLAYIPYKGIPIYPLFERTEENEQLAKDYDVAIKELRQDGTLSKLSEKYLGKDVFEYVED